MALPPGRYQVVTVAPFATCPASEVTVPSHGYVTVEIACEGEGVWS
jgi:hypothetical protein